MDSRPTKTPYLGEKKFIQTFRQQWKPNPPNCSKHNVAKTIMCHFVTSSFRIKTPTFVAHSLSNLTISPFWITFLNRIVFVKHSPKVNATLIIVEVDMMTGSPSSAVSTYLSTHTESQTNTTTPCKPRKPLSCRHCQLPLHLQPPTTCPNTNFWLQSLDGFSIGPRNVCEHSTSDH